MSTPISRTISDLRGSFESNKIRSYDVRISQLHALNCLIEENLTELKDVLWKDLNRHPTFSSKILGGCIGSITSTSNRLKEWMLPLKKDHGTLSSSSMEVRYQPRGIVLIIGTWNFPCPLIFKPLTSALAAGNTVCIKLSEVCVRVSKLLARLLTH